MSLLSYLRYFQISAKWLTNGPKLLGNIIVNQRHIQQNGGKNVAVIESLDDRELLRVHGTEVVLFLQGLITNDMLDLEKPNGPSSIYAMFLNKSGRVLYDTIIYKTNNPLTYYIECDKNVSSELRRHLRLHRVRRKIDIDHIAKEYNVWSVFNPKANDNENDLTLDETCNVPKSVIIRQDPRLQGLGKRIISTIDTTWNDLAALYARFSEISIIKPCVDYNYRTQRYRFGVAEGTTEMPPGKCLPLEANADYLNGVNFKKGCYLGQELTARVHHTGVIRKRHMPLRLTVPLSNNSQPTIETPAGKKIGKVLGATMNKALGLLRVEDVVYNKNLIVNGEPCIAEKPQWWPQATSND